MTWLEPTRRCNITCDACFAQNDPESDKPLESIEHELDTMLRLRRCDAVLIAGGEPLVHPRIVDVTRLVASRGCKPVLVTNGVLLDRAILADLKRAGLHGVTIHVDSHQSRPGWIGRSERDLNALRSHFADLVHDQGHLTCAFNTTIFPDTLDQVADVVGWAVRRPDRVHVLTLICVRLVELEGGFEYQCGGRSIDLGDTPYSLRGRYRHLLTEDLQGEIRKVLPAFGFCAFLGGTVRADSPKWVLGCHVTSKSTSYGHAGPFAMEIFQNIHHAFRRRFLAYASPRASSMGHAALLLGIVDRDLRRAAARFLNTVVRRPREFFRPLYVQSLSVVQPVDILPNGEMDTCDGCPNRTYWRGRLVAACRLDEYKRYGGPVAAVPVEGKTGNETSRRSVGPPEESGPGSG